MSYINFNSIGFHEVERVFHNPINAAQVTHIIVLCYDVLMNNCLFHDLLIFKYRASSTPDTDLLQQK